MMTSTLTVVGREVFIDDYNEEIDNDYRLDPDEILQDMVELMEESPESYQHLHIDSEQTNDGMNKLFSFTSYEGEDGLGTRIWASAMNEDVRLIQPQNFEITEFIEDYTRLVRTDGVPPSADFLQELVADAAAQAMDGQFIIWVDDDTIDDEPKEFIFNLLEDAVIYMGVD